MGQALSALGKDPGLLFSTNLIIQIWSTTTKKKKEGGGKEWSQEGDIGNKKEVKKLTLYLATTSFSNLIVVGLLRAPGPWLLHLLALKFVGFGYFKHLMSNTDH